MTHRLDSLNEREKFAVRKIVEPGLRLLTKRHYKVDAILWRPQTFDNLTQTTSSGVPEAEDAYRDVYGDYSGLGQERDEQDKPILQDGTQPPYTIFWIVVLVPPLSFVPFSGQYHSTEESTFSYTLDDRLKMGDFLAIRHPDPDNNDGDRSMRIFKVDHAKGVGVTVRMYTKFVLTPFPTAPPGMLDAITAWEATP